MIVIDFTNNKGDDAGHFDRLGRRVTLSSNHPDVRNIISQRQKLIELAGKISGESGPFNFCIRHPMHR